MCTTLLHVNKPHQNRSGEDRDDEEEDKSRPVVVGTIDNARNNERTDERGHAVRDTEQAKEHPLEPRRAQARKYRLGVAIVGCLAEAEQDVIEVEFCKG